MMTGSVIVGSAVSGLMVFTAGPAAGMANVIVCRPGDPFEQLITSRSEPGPLSSVLVTTKLQTRVNSTLAVVGRVGVGRRSRGRGLVEDRRARIDVGVHVDHQT